MVLLAAGAAPSIGEQKVLFDQGHGQQFLVENEGPLDLSGLAAVFAEGGLQVVAGTGPLTAGRLAGVRAVVISGPFKPLAPEEIRVLLEFVEQGGTLAAMLHIPTPLSALLTELGIDHSNGVVRERDDVLGGEPLNFAVTRLAAHPLTADLDGFRIYGAWALLDRGDSAEVIARSGPRSWVDLDGDGRLSAPDAVQSLGLVVTGSRGRGRFAVFGDDAMFQNQFLEGSNLRLARNLAAWLAGPGLRTAESQSIRTSP